MCVVSGLGFCFPILVDAHLCFVKLDHQKVELNTLLALIRKLFSTNSHEISSTFAHIKSLNS